MLIHFLFGVSFTINIILILGIYIYYKFKKGVRDINEMVEDKEVFGWAVHYYDEENPE